MRPHAMPHLPNSNALSPTQLWKYALFSLFTFRVVCMLSWPQLGTATDRHPPLGARCHSERPQRCCQDVRFLLSHVRLVAVTALNQISLLSWSALRRLVCPLIPRASLRNFKCHTRVVTHRHTAMVLPGPCSCSGTPRWQCGVRLNFTASTFTSSPATHLSSAPHSPSPLPSLHPSRLPPTLPCFKHDGEPHILHSCKLTSG